MATPIRSSLFDNSTKDGVDPDIGGAEVDENPNRIADILDGTTQADLGGAGTIHIRALKARTVDAAAAAFKTPFNLEWDPSDGSNNNAGMILGYKFIFPNSSDTQTDLGWIRVQQTDDTASLEAATLFLGIKGTAGALANVVSLTTFNLSPVASSTVSLGGAANRWDDLFMSGRFDFGATQNEKFIEESGDNVRIVNLDDNGSIQMEADSGLQIKNIVTAVVPLTDGVNLYAEDVAGSSELKVRDEAGNTTTLSPHNFNLVPGGPSEEMAWSYYSERNGRAVNVDMLKLVRVVERVSGERLVFEGDV